METRKRRRSTQKEKQGDKKKQPNEETSGSSAGAGKCSVCLDTVESTKMKSLPCAHVFHEICIDKWLTNSNECPICRWPIVESNNSSLMDGTGLRETHEDIEHHSDSSSESSEEPILSMDDESNGLNGEESSDEESSDEESSDEELTELSNEESLVSCDEDSNGSSGESTYRLCGDWESIECGDESTYAAEFNTYFDFGLDESDESL